MGTQGPGARLLIFGGDGGQRVSDAGETHRTEWGGSSQPAPLFSQQPRTGLRALPTPGHPLKRSRPCPANPDWTETFPPKFILCAFPPSCPSTGVFSATPLGSCTSFVGGLPRRIFLYFYEIPSKISILQKLLKLDLLILASQCLSLENQTPKWREINKFGTTCPIVCSAPTPSPGSCPYFAN